ncbi:hypothetical protein DL765_011683 [Monosporascus sp. GIB2]|nr:hypothetical protein DL765_011683 [Monosporascus sp. GIB2]
MSTDATAVMAPPDHHQQPQPQPQVVHSPHSEIAGESSGHIDPADVTMKDDTIMTDEKHSGNGAQKPIGLHSPPDSNNAMKLDGSDDSDLSDLEDRTADFTQPPTASPVTTRKEEEDEDIGDVFPDHWSGTVPVFKPTMHQFKDFKKFMEKVDSYGMKSGIIKIIPPQEWKDKLPPLDDLVKQVTVRQPIKQEIMGSNGTYRQVNILHQRSYNLPQWRQLCDQSEHQPPARRGERRAQQEKPKAAPRTRAAVASAATRSSSSSKRRGRGGRGRGKRGSTKDNAADSEERPMTPVSPRPTENIVESVEQEIGAPLDEDEDDTPKVGRMGGVRLSSKEKTQSTSARRKYARREASARIDEEAFKDFDYKMDISDYTPERCEELERTYWKTLTYAPPLYGADLPGTLFDESTETWNLNKLPNLLDVLGTKVPGVNTAYLYLGMWKATFAWHLEDVDLYSINYLHFGAPKQWYSISQGDARRFEAAMRSIWPTDAKACDQFLRHKAFLISPNHLQQYFNIKVNKCVSYPGEFVVTYPYGYHSGYNLGYNCAEAVNFALDSWLPMGKIAKKCECAQAQDSVWVDVYEIERKLRGEETDYEYSEDEEEEEEDEDEDDELDGGIATTNVVTLKQTGRKRKRAMAEKGERKGARKVKKIRLRVKTHIEPPCCLCPHDIPGTEMLPTDDGRKAHRICALYGPETWIETVDDKEVVANVANISKARLDLKCLYCRSKKGACFQCSQKKCARSYHATCAAAAGVLVEEGEVPIFGEDGTEYKEQAFEFSCRFHRTKREKKRDGNALDDCQKTRQAAAALKKGDICQLQYYRGEIFAGVVVENRADEETFLVDIIPNGCEAYETISNTAPPMLTFIRDRVEVEWKWLLLPDPADLHLPKASPNAIPMPTSRKAKEHINATKRQTEELPRADSPFVDGFTWAEFNSYKCTNKDQAKVDFSKENQIWFYLGRKSTEARAQYTEDPGKPRHNPRSNFLDTIPRPFPTPQPRKPYRATFAPHIPAGPRPARTEKPYEYKPKNPITPSFVHSPYTSQQFTPRPSPYTAQQFVPKPSQTTFQQPLPQPTAQPSLFTAQQFIPKPAYTSTTFTPQTPLAKPAPANPEPARLQAPPAQPSQAHPDPQTQFKHVEHSQVKPPQARPSQTKPSQAKPSRSPRASAPQSGHTRNSQSLNLHRGSSLPYGTDQRFRTSSFSFGSSRFETNNKSPFSHGFTQPPGLGPLPSPQNGQLFQAQARARSSSSASTKSFTTPMTSSAIRPSSSASSQGTTAHSQAVQPQVASFGSANRPSRPCVLQKYAFFQVHHNRDSTKYRTPYAPWGGFTNGYEGNLRAHLMRTPDALFGIKRPSIEMGNITIGTPPTPRYSFSNDQLTNNTPTPLPTFRNPQHVNLNNQTYNKPWPVPPSHTPQPATVSPLPANTQPNHQGFSSKPPPSTPSRPPVKMEQHPPPITPLNSWDLGQVYGSNLHPALQAHVRQEMVKRQMIIDAEMKAYRERHQNSTQSTNRVPPPVVTMTGTSAPSPTATEQSVTSTPAPTTDQKQQIKEDGTSQSAKIPKRTYVPPPRPWETLRKMQQTSAGTTPSPYPPGTTATTPTAIPTTFVNSSMTPTGTAPAGTPVSTSRAYVTTPPPPGSNPSGSTVISAQVSNPDSLIDYGTGLSRHPLDQGVQPSNPSPAFTEPVRIQAVPGLSAQHNPAKPVIAEPSPAPTREIPEVSEESMELVENIIMNAIKASGSC